MPDISPQSQFLRVHRDYLVDTHLSGLFFAILALIACLVRHFRSAKYVESPQFFGTRRDADFLDPFLRIIVARNRSGWVYLHDQVLHGIFCT